jgi:hypothetical protein
MSSRSCFEVLRRLASFVGQLTGGVGDLGADLEHHVIDGAPALVKRLFERIEHEACARRPAHSPADDAAGVGVNDEGDINQVRPGRDVSEVGDPKGIRPRRLELG